VPKVEPEITQGSVLITTATPRTSNVEPIAPEALPSNIPIAYALNVPDNTK
tara:strand:+ start:175 stop:327 length:153 start_codon:yes stop_codon:yes gene_type:complete